MNRIETYEYCRAIIKDFLNTEELLYRSNQDDIYGSGSWHVNFFEFNLNQISDLAVREELKYLTTNDSTGQVQYNAALARVQSLYTNLILAIGEEALNDLENSCIIALLNMNDSSRRKKGNVYKRYKQLLADIPIVLISVLGSSEFMARHAKYAKAKSVVDSLKLSITGTKKK